MFLNLALKKRAIASCSPQYFHINKKKTWKVLISCFLQLSQLPFSKTEKVPHSDIRGQNSYSYNTQFTNSNCLVKRS